MRPIDADALQEAMKSVTNDPTCPLHLAAEIDQIIDAMPTVGLTAAYDTCCAVYRERQDNIRALGTLRTEIHREEDLTARIRLCIRAISAMTGDKVFEKTELERLEEPHNGCDHEDGCKRHRRGRTASRQHAGEMRTGAVRADRK